MLDENQMIHPGRSGDAAAELDAALVAADEDMLSAISDGLDLEAGLARILKELGGPSATRPPIPAPAPYPDDDRRTPDAAISPNITSRTHRRDADAVSPVPVAVLIGDVNASDQAAENQFLRARQAAGIAARTERTAEHAVAKARTAEDAHLAIQAGHPRRRAALPRQMTLALGTVVLDGLACYTAAQALGGSLDATLAWTGLFAGVLAAEAALGFNSDHGERAWHVLVTLTGFLVILLSAVRFWFLAATGTGGPVPVIAGACLFAGVTADSLPSAIARCGPRRPHRPGVPAGRQARRVRQRGSPGPRPTRTQFNVTVSSTPISDTSRGWR